MSLLWAYLKKQKEGWRYKKTDPVNALCASISPSNQDAKRKLCSQDSAGGCPTHRAVNNAGKQCMTPKPSTWTKGNLGTGISIQILLTVTSLSHSRSSPVPGNGPVPAVGRGMCASVS